MVFSIIMGMCVLGADAYVLNGLLHQRADALQLALTAIFALSVFGLWLWGYYRALCFLNLYAREEAAIPQAATALTSFAQDVNVHAKAGDWRAPPSLAAAPLLDRRLKQITLALRRGAPLLSGDMSDSEERHFPGPERELRTYMDIVLNTGIAGTFVSILMTLGQPQGLTAETLLTHVGPGMTSGLAAVIANIGLRLCHRALQDEQDALAAHVEDALNESLLCSLPKSVTSPEDRLVSATERVIDDTQGMIVHALDKQNVATQKILADQSTQIDAVLKEYALTVGQILTRQVQQPIHQIAVNTEALATQAGELVRHSGTWAETTADLKAAHLAFLKMHREAHERHEASMSELFTRYRESLDTFLETAKEANRAGMAENHEIYRRQLKDHEAAVASLLNSFQERFATLQAQQEAVHRRLTDAALESFGTAVETRLAAIEQRVAATLGGVEARLPDAVRMGINDALGQTVLLLDAVREQAAGLTHTVAQVSHNADRQLLAYERWQERAAGVQSRLEQVVIDGQAAQSEMISRWHITASEALERVRTTFIAAGDEAQSGYASLSAALAPLRNTLDGLQQSTQQLHTALADLSPLVVAAQVTLGEASPSLNEMVSACHEINTALANLSSSTTLLLDSARSAHEDVIREARETNGDLRALTESVGVAAARCGDAAAAISTLASRAGLVSDGHVLSSIVMTSQPDEASDSAIS